MRNSRTFATAHHAPLLHPIPRPRRQANNKDDKAQQSSRIEKISFSSRYPGLFTRSPKMRGKANHHPPASVERGGEGKGMGWGWGHDCASVFSVSPDSFLSHLINLHSSTLSPHTINHHPPLPLLFPLHSASLPIPPPAFCTRFPHGKNTNPSFMHSSPPSVFCPWRTVQSRSTFFLSGHLRVLHTPLFLA